MSLLYAAGWHVRSAVKTSALRCSALLYEQACRTETGRRTCLYVRVRYVSAYHARSDRIEAVFIKARSIWAAWSRASRIHTVPGQTRWMGREGESPGRTR